MKRSCIYWLVSLFVGLAISAEAADPLRVFVRGGKKSHGPGAHEHERFLRDWTQLLRERGMVVQGAMEFPTEADLAKTDVLVMYAQDGGTVPEERRDGLNEFLKRGGGVVVIHTAAVSTDPEHWKTIIGGAWVPRQTKWLEGEMSLYFTDSQHPITRGASNFDMDDEIYYDMDLLPEIHVLAASYTPKMTSASNSNKAEESTAGGTRPSVYDIQPQMWTYERTVSGGEPYRAFVSIPGHLYVNFQRPNYRAILLRGIAWAGKRSNPDEFCTPQELASLRYPEGGPTAPEEAAEKLEIHPEFEIDLVAAEPLINKPINIDWDADGRLWVAETPEYPNGRRLPNVEPWKESGSLIRQGPIEDRPARDRISILIDENGDGRADKKQVFYEGLELVTSFVFFEDGVIASAAPDIWLLRDRDGDGVAEIAEKLYTGLGIGDTHAVINNLRWGFDGWIYATHGYSASDHVLSGDGRTDFGRIGSGVVRFKPDGSGFEQYTSKGGNTWGLDITWDNEVFFTQPTSGELLMHVVIPESILARGQLSGVRSYKPLIVRRKSFPLMEHHQQAYVQIDLVGSFTAAAGCAIYDGGAWPAEWNYSYFTTEPTINIVHHEIVRPEGVSYQAEKTREAEFIGGRDLWFRPIETRIGPDGALYLVDFYNQAVIHNDTRGPRHGPANAAVRPDRDHYFGRLWRVNHQDAKSLKIPKLAKARPRELINALEHPNGHVRMRAHRKLVEMGDERLVEGLARRAQSGSAEAKVAALWTLHHLGPVPPRILLGAMRDSDGAVRRNATRIAGVQASADAGPVQQEIIARMDDPDPSVQLAALIAAGEGGADRGPIPEVVRIYPKLNDPWLKSAAVGALSSAPVAALHVALSVGSPDMASLIKELVQMAGAKRNPNDAAQVLIAAADQRAPNNLKRAVLEELARQKLEQTPQWTPALEQALVSLLESDDAFVSAAALPFVAQWDTSGALRESLHAVVDRLSSQLGDPGLSDEQRLQMISSLLGVPERRDEVLRRVAQLLKTAAPSAQSQIVTALGQLSDPGVGNLLAAEFLQLSPEAQETAFNQLLKRADWSHSFLNLVERGSLELGGLSPANLYRLRTHSDPEVSARANELWNKARGDVALEKDALIAELAPVVSQPGNVENGKQLFIANCATCHKMGGVGVDVGPVLTGMGAHGAVGLLPHIIDPNREVDPSYVTYSIETKDGEIYDGIIVRENAATVVLKNAAGEQSIPTAQIQARKNTGRSLMPEGFEALGGEGVRDLLAFMTADDSRFRFIDLGQAFTADSRRGLFSSEEPSGGMLPLNKYGVAFADGVPFNIIDPAKSPTRKNLVVLQGGPGNAFSRTMPQRVEVPVGLSAAKLHFLGAVAGWGFPFGGDEGTPAMKVTIRYADGKSEEWVLKNGVEIADYIREVNVPGSKLAKGLVRNQQIRWFTKEPSRQVPIESLVLESYGNMIAPVTAAITAELPGSGKGTAHADAPSSAAAPAKDQTASEPGFEWGQGKRVLLVGGGSAHDYGRWFDQEDKAILRSAGDFSVHYTEDPAVVARELPRADIAVLSINRSEFSAEPVRKALEEFIQAGKGLVLLHPGLWYNWPDWPAYNRQIAGGGSRGHDNLGPFEVHVGNRNHPVTRGLPESFQIVDELYWFEPDPAGTPIEILATANSPKKGKKYPMIFVVKHPQTRIVGITLGHDGRAHQLPEFRRLLVNAVNWVAEKK